MSVRAFASDRLRDIGAAGKWFLLVVPMAAVVGTLCAAFLWSLDRVTEIRLDHPVLLFGLPVAGVAIGLLYHWMGRAAEGGNNLIVDQIHEPGGGVPLRMAPLILIATVTSHLFGASVGREGTAVQVGGSIAGGAARLLGLSPQDVRIILMTGIAAGFGAVFGTPIAGAVFALEVLAVGRIEYEALVPAVLAAVVGNWACQLWGVHHVAYHVTFAPRGVIEVGSFAIDLLLLAKVTAAGVAFGLAGLLFSELSHSFGALFRKICPIPYLRPAIGGILTIGLVYAIGTRAYLGLGVTSPDIGDPSIVAFFGGQHFAWAWAWKILFTVLAISTGFKGGEVTPLFFIGAALGNAIAGMVGAPVDLFAALGFVAIFAAASNTPLACTIMGIELFGGANTVYIAVACFVAYLCSGHSGIYLSQRIGVPKTTTGILPPDIPLRQAREIGYAALERMVVAFPKPKRHSPTNLKKEQVESPMSYPHHVIADEIGMVRVYMKPKDKYRKTGSGKLRSAFSSRPLYQELVRQAKAAGLINAVAHHTHYGFSNHGDIGSIEPESINPSLTMCVELVGPKQTLETFCRQHGDLLQGKVIVYKHVERWRIGAHPAEVKAMLHAPANGEGEDKVAAAD